MTRGKIRYFFQPPRIEVPRAAVLAAIRAGYRGDYMAEGELTEENLNWLKELSAKEGWHQKSQTPPGDRVVIMRVTNDSDKKEA